MQILTDASTNCSSELGIGRSLLLEPIKTTAFIVLISGTIIDAFAD